MPQDPAIIQSQIEETRAELAETIDAIAELVSPRRVAERAGEQARAKLAELRSRAGHHGGQPLEIGAETAGGAGISAAATPVAAPGQAGVTRNVRWGRVALAVGATMLLVVSTTRRRRRQRG